MRICVFSRSFFPALGGQERVAEVLAREFTNLGHTVLVLTDAPPGEVDGRPYEVRRTGRFWDRVAVFRGVDRVLFMSSSLQGLLGCWLAGKRCYVAHHSMYGIGNGAERLAGILKAWLSKLTVNICISEFQRKRLPARAILIPNPLDQAFLDWPAGNSVKFDFGFVGRLVPDKGVGLLMDALKSVHSSFPEASLRVIGDGPERSALEMQARQLGLSDRVNFSGPLHGDEMVSAMADCGCLVVPSLCEETFGLAALEGLAVCRWVIVTRRGALPEVIGPFGTVVDPDSEPLALAMVEFLLKKHAYHAQSPARTSYVNGFSSKALALRYLEVLQGTEAKS